MADNDDLVQQFVDIASCDRATAKYLLDANVNNLQAALDMFMETHAGAGGGTAAAGGVSDSLGAKRSMGGGYADDDPDNVRPADERKRQRLMDFPMGGGGMGGMGMMGMAHHPFRNLHAEARQRGGGAFHAAAGDGAAAAGGGQDDKLSKKLADLFSPPHKIMFEGSFQEARTKAKEEGKMLLVNIQDDKEFACHTLNRDTWKDETVQEMVDCSCVFWQMLRTSPEGAIYCDRYKVTAFPHVALLDARTAGIKWTWVKKKEDSVLDARLLLEILSDVSSRDPSDVRPPRSHPQPRPPQPQQQPPAASGAVAAPTEDEQLAAAIAQSLQEAGTGKGGGAAAAGGGGAGGGQGGGGEEDAAAPAAAEGAADELAGVELLPEPKEPEEVKAGVRVQLRLMNGVKRTRVFRGSEPIKALFKYAQQELGEEARGRRIDLKTLYPLTSLRLQWEQDMGSAKLNGAMVQAAFLD